MMQKNGDTQPTYDKANIKFDVLQIGIYIYIYILYISNSIWDLPYEFKKQ